MKPYLSIPLAAAYVCLAILWLVDFAGLRNILPFYVIAILAVVVVFMLPRDKLMEEAYDPNFAQWFLDSAGIAGVFVGLLLFGIASGAVFREPIQMNFWADLGLGIAAVSLCSGLIPRRWLNGLSTNRKRR